MELSFSIPVFEKKEVVSKVHFVLMEGSSINRTEIFYLSPQEPDELPENAGGHSGTT